MKRLIPLLLCICLILCLRPVTADAANIYSTTANSGIRQELCTSLEGTGAADYYTGSYSYDQLSELYGDQLLTELRTLLTQTHTKTTTYAQCKDLAVKTDCENGDGTTISLIYTSYSAIRSDYINDQTNGWNREHVWPKSQGGFSETDTPGCDLHHVRPSDSLVNSTRGNRLFGTVSNGKNANGAEYTGYALGGASTSGYFEPLDNVKGDVARICLYVYVRYGGEYSKCGKITNVFQSVDVLLDWCALDPVDTWEMGRNEVVAAIQGNRNVFIDYPELAWLLFDEQIPEDLVTPSGKAENQVCEHRETVIQGEYEATCTGKGYTGDTYCADCGEKMESGKKISALGHKNSDGDDTCDRCGGAVECGHGKTKLDGQLEPSCGTEGYSGDKVCVYCGNVLEQGQLIPATGEHGFGAWTVIEEAAADSTGLQQRACAACGATEEAVIPKLEPEPTAPQTQPTEPETEPTQSETQPGTEPDPSQPSLKPTEPTATEPEVQDDRDERTDYRWLVFTVIGVGAVTSVVIVLIQTKRKK